MKNPFPILITIAALALSQLMCSLSGEEPSVDFEAIINITTFADTNQNGVQDAGEAGLPNVPIRVDAILSVADTFESIDQTRENGQTTYEHNFSVGGMIQCPIVTVSVTPPEGMVSTSGSNKIEISDWNCEAGAPAEQNRTASFGLAPATPTSTPTATTTSTPSFTPTPAATADPAANAEVIFEKGNTTDLVDCSGTEFAFNVKDPQGVRQVYIEFAVAGFDTDFSTIAGTLDLTNSGGDTWSGTLNDTFSTQGKVTYWRVVVVDNNGIQTVYHEDGKFSFYARDKSCK